MVIRECFRCFYHIYNSRLGRWLHNCMTRNRHYRRIRSHQSLDHSYTDSPVFDMEDVRVKVVPLAKTNYSYIIQDKASLQVAVVDPGDGYYLSQLAEKEFHQDVSAILVTHKHWDHSAGMAELLSHYPQAKSYAFHSEKICDITTRVKDGDSISLGGVSVRVVHTPGHTEGSVCFFIRPTKGPPLLFTGDTLFLGGMGAFFEGTAVTIMMTIEKLLSLPEDTLVFPGHEYSETTLKFALLMEPRNPELQAKAAWVEMRRRKFYCTVPSTLSEERSYNPFLRIRSPAIQTVTSTATPMRALIALQNYRIAKRSEYKNITLSGLPLDDQWKKMGCCQTVHAAPAEASPEEKALCLRESSLGYCKHPAKALVDELLRLSGDGKFSPSDMNSLAVKFELNIKELDDPDSSLYAFYRNMKGEKGSYRVSPLGALMVLLAKGTAQEKAALLYQLMPSSDPQHDAGIRSVSEVRELLETLVNMACLWLPKLSQTETLSDPGTLPTEKVNMLLESASNKKEAAVEDLLSSLMKGKEGVSQADFVMQLSTSKLKVLTASYDLRKFVLG